MGWWVWCARWWRDSGLHSLMLPDGSQRASAYLRWARTGAYALLGAAGVLLLVSPIFTETYGMVATVMAVFLAIGGIASSFGAATQRWVGEFIGLPLVVTAFFVFGVLTLVVTLPETPYIAAANMSLLTGFSLALSARWRVVFAVYRLARRFGNGKGEGS